MSFTNSKLVKSYLTDSFPRQEKISDQPVQLNSTEFISFFSGAVDSPSFRVKSKQSNKPIRISLLLNSNTENINSLPLVPDSVVVASDSSLGIIFTENIDYIIDYGQGNIILKSGGAISVGTTVTIWYQAYVTYTLTVDYLLNSDRGDIKRVPSGAIADSEIIQIDYTPVSSAYNDVIIDNAVLMANSLIDKEIDSAQDFGADPVLQAAATFRALEIICQTSAVRQLAQQKGQEKSSSGWVRLAEMFSKRSSELLDKFHPPFDNLKSPEHS